MSAVAHGIRPHAALALLALLPLLAGCAATTARSGSAASSPAASTTTAAPATSESTGAKAGPSITDLTPESLCSVGVADAQAAEHATPAIMTLQAKDDDLGVPECKYSAEPGVTIYVKVFTPDEETFDPSAGIETLEPLTPIAGLGRTAGGNKDEVEVDGGSYVLDLAALRDDSTSPRFTSVSGLTALARLFVARLS